MMDIGHFNKFQSDHLATKEAKILIVDDDPAIAKSIKGVLALNGLESHSVSGGYAALEELRHNKY
ncbi:MAG: response regulator, partial [Desulfuromusa sp.]|nr:response regulator [Desulfuromusa sp.]